MFVGGLKEDMEDDDLRTYFTQFGNVIEVTRLTEKDTGKKRGFGFVEFDDYDPVDKCIQKVGGYYFCVKKWANNFITNFFHSYFCTILLSNREIIQSVVGEWMLKKR